MSPLKNSNNYIKIHFYFCYVKHMDCLSPPFFLFIFYFFYKWLLFATKMEKSFESGVHHWQCSQRTLQKLIATQKQNQSKNHNHNPNNNQDLQQFHKRKNKPTNCKKSTFGNSNPKFLKLKRRWERNFFTWFPIVTGVTRRALNVLLRTERPSKILVVTGVMRHAVTTEASERKRGSCDREKGREKELRKGSWDRESMREKEFWGFENFEAGRSFSSF